LTQCEAYFQVCEAGLPLWGWLSGWYRALQIGHCKFVDCHCHSWLKRYCGGLFSFSLYQVRDNLYIKFINITNLLVAVRRSVIRLLGYCSGDSDEHQATSTGVNTCVKYSFYNSDRKILFLKYLFIRWWRW